MREEFLVLDVKLDVLMLTLAGHMLPTMIWTGFKRNGIKHHSCQAHALERLGYDSERKSSDFANFKPDGFSFIAYFFISG
jgi:hypothetical protein